MKLTSEQIDQLYNFTEKKLVHWYDVQIELVDHLASKIEEELENNNSLSFDSALQKVYDGFGIFGFAKIVQEKEKELQRSAHKMWWKELISFFKIPNILLVILIGVVLWLCTQFISIPVLFNVFIGCYFSASIVLAVIVYQKMRHTKKLLMFQSGIHISLIVFIYDFSLLNYYERLNPVSFCIISALGVLFTICSFKTFLQVNKKARELYPLAFKKE